ncbi:G-type lectin S-receptor-like serine/threonine-protein kinase [Senna tora]|uniref:non-specific serine/threonine protein kinase n=1 Tax=Senna tora TaxID=362788 RepID=A0A834T1G8_9FABA|nr:G-type lectin S-receptor-like serine/threonine-protein kinase [Senna tora]
MPTRLVLLLSLALYLSSVVVAISPGSTLHASNTSHAWSSPNDTFSLRFIPIQPPTSPPSFTIGIVYSGGVPVVWTAGYGAIVDSHGSFHFLSTGSLRLVDGSGAIVWDSGTSNLGVSSASLEDNGNLVLSNSTTSTIWSSFHLPTDTIVPSQNFTTSMVMQSGSYSFRLLSFGNLVLTWNNSVTYWNASINGSLTWPVLEIQPKGVLSIHDKNLTSSSIVAYSSDHAEGSDVLRILKLDTDGNMRIYSSSRGSGIETARWVAVKDQCEVFGCPSQNFEFKDANDRRKGCKRKRKLEDCPGRVSMLELEHSRLFTYPPLFLVNHEVVYIPISACRGNCLAADSCFASTSLSDGSGFCYLKTEDFFSGYQNPALSSTSYIKVCLPLAPNPPFSLNNEKGKDWSIQAWMVVVLILGTLLACIVFEGSIWCWCCRNKSQRSGFEYRFKRFSGKYSLLEYASGSPIHFSYKEIMMLTNGFNKKLGSVGGFGSVYKGILADGNVVAVKKLEGIENLEEGRFRLEVATISNTHHLNLVSLIGFCFEGHHRILVYEFMKNGSLKDFLLEQQYSQKVLEWECRFNIAMGTAKGITYLHEECQKCIVHSNIKPENILFDENHNVKLSDFGFNANLNIALEEEHRYYKAPESLLNLPMTSKSDVYSYGMVLLEIVSGRRNLNDTSRNNFAMWAYGEFEKDLAIKELVRSRYKICYWQNWSYLDREKEECNALKKANEKGEEFMLKELGLWLRVRNVGKKVEWWGTQATKNDKKDPSDERRVGTVKKVETDDVLEKLARMSMVEKGTGRMANVKEGVERSVNKVEKGGGMSNEVNVDMRLHTQMENVGAIEVSDNIIMEIREENMTSTWVNGKRTTLIGVEEGKGDRVLLEIQNMEEHENMKENLDPKLKPSAWQEYSGSEKMVDDGLFRVEAKNDVVMVLACESNEVGEVRVIINGRQRMQIQRDFLVKVILSHAFIELWNFEELVNMSAATEAVVVVVESLGDDGSGRVEEGLRKSIGDSQMTSIWKDPWVPSETPLIIDPPRNPMPSIEKVNDLIVVDGEEWDVEKLCIPSDKEQGGDRWIWELDNRGTYSVKSEYRNAMFDVRGQFEMGLDIDYEVASRFWKRLRKFPIQLR